MFKALAMSCTWTLIFAVPCAMVYVAVTPSAMAWLLALPVTVTSAVSLLGVAIAAGFIYIVSRRMRSIRPTNLG